MCLTRQYPLSSLSDFVPSETSRGYRGGNPGPVEDPGVRLKLGGRSVPRGSRSHKSILFDPITPDWCPLTLLFLLVYSFTKYPGFHPSFTTNNNRINVYEMFTMKVTLFRRRKDVLFKISIKLRTILLLYRYSLGLGLRKFVKRLSGPEGRSCPSVRGPRVRDPVKVSVVGFRYG